MLKILNGAHIMNHDSTRGFKTHLVACINSADKVIYFVSYTAPMLAELRPKLKSQGVKIVSNYVIRAAEEGCCDVLTHVRLKQCAL